ncbi:MAG: hypothetical protein Kow0068_24420 [Marinilabiliales bacterium]
MINFIYKSGFLYIMLIMLIACGEKLEKQIDSSYPSGLPSKVSYYKWVGDKKVVVKEIRYYTNGEKEVEGEYNDLHQKEGKWTYWYENGKKWSEGTFKNGLSDGKFTIYYQSGKKNYEASYKQGVPHGEWIFYDEYGKKYKKVIFKNGEKVSEKMFN